MRAVAAASTKGSTRRGSTNRAVAVTIVKRRSRNVTRPSRTSTTPSTAGAAVEPSIGEGTADPQGDGAVSHHEVVVELDGDPQGEPDPAGRRPGRPRRRAGAGASSRVYEPRTRRSSPWSSPRAARPASSRSPSQSVERPSSGVTATRRAVSATRYAPSPRPPAPPRRSRSASLRRRRPEPRSDGGRRETR